MAKIGGTQINVGVGIEATAGTAVAATIFPKWYDLSIQGVSDKLLFEGQRGIRNMSSNSIIRRKYTKGSITMVPNTTNVPVFAYLALGTLTSTGPTDTTVYTHTIVVQNSNASMKTGTFIVERGGEVTERSAGCVVNQLSLDVSNDFAKMTAAILGGYPDTSTLTESYSVETEFAYHQYTVKFGTSLSNAAGNSATPLKAFSLTIDNQVDEDSAYLSGANTPVTGGFTAGRLKVTGSYTAILSGTTEADLYKALTKQAAIVTFTGANVTGSTTAESITIKLGRLILTDAPIEVNIGGLTMIKQAFQVEYEATDKEIQIVVVNGVASY